MKRLEFHITYICNHACVFCSEDERMRKYSAHPLTAAQIVAVLVDRARKGYDHVNFTGGEPTLLPGFLKVLAAAKKLGYRTYVGTNGTLFAGEAFARTALPLIDELSFSVHWFDADGCALQTGRRTHFGVYALAAANVARFRAPNNSFFCNVVLDRQNFRDALKIVKFVRESPFPVGQFLLSVVAPEGAADAAFGELSFDLEGLLPLIPGVVDYCDRQGLILRFFGLPTCVLGEKYADYANDAHWEERHTIERFTNSKGEVALVDIHSADNSRKRTFVAKCEGCRWKSAPCTGVFERYLEFYPF